MDRTIIVGLSDRLADFVSDDFRKFFFSTQGYGNKMPLQDHFYFAITEFLEDENIGPNDKVITRDQIMKKHYSFTFNIRRTCKRLASPGPRTLRETVTIDKSLMDRWLYKSEYDIGYNLYYTYPYFSFLTARKQYEYLNSDLISFFFIFMKKFDYDLTRFYSYYYEKSIDFPAYGVSQNKKGESAFALTIENQKYTIYNRFQNKNITYDCIREENAKPLTSQHKKVYDYIITLYLNKFVFSDQDLKMDNTVTCSHSDLAKLLGIQDRTSAVKNNIISEVLRDLSMNSFINYDDEGNVQNILRFASGFETIDSIDGTKEYIVSIGSNSFLNSYADQRILRTCTLDVESLEDNTKLLVPFLQRERINLYDLHETKKIYNVLSFRNYVRIARKTCNGVLNIIRPLLDDCKANKLFIKDYYILENNTKIAIEYIPLTSKQRKDIVFSIEDKSLIK